MHKTCTLTQRDWLNFNICFFCFSCKPFLESKLVHNSDPTPQCSAVNRSNEIYSLLLNVEQRLLARD